MFALYQITLIINKSIMEIFLNNNFMAKEF